MRAGSFTLAVATLAGMASAMTPPGLIPANTENMTAFFDTTTLAVNGANIPINNTANAPTVALDKQLNGTTFAVIMTDPDAGGSGNGSSAFLHWMQDGLTSAATSTTVGGKTVYALENPTNVSAVQTYKQPGPPAGTTHRYTQYLLKTTGVSGFSVSTTVATEITTRQNFDMQSFATQANLTIISANYFNVTGV